MLSYEKVIKEINYLLYDSHIEDEKLLTRIKELEQIVSNYMKYKNAEKNISIKNDSNISNRIDKYIEEYTLRKNDLELQLDGYLPSCGSIELDELNYKINNLERVKSELPRILNHLIILLGNNYSISKDKLINECIKECFNCSSVKLFDKIYSTDTYNKFFIDSSLFDKIGDILFNKELFDKLKSATIKYNEIEKLKKENANMKLFIKYHDLIEKRNGLSFSKELLDKKIMKLSEDEIEPLESKLSRIKDHKIKEKINFFRIRYNTSKLNDLVLMSDILFSKRTKRQNCINKIETYLSSKGLNVDDIPSVLFSKKQYEYEIKENEKLISTKEIEYQKYIDLLDEETKNILLTNFEDIVNIINIFGLNDSTYIYFYIMYILEKIDTMEITTEECREMFSTNYNKKIWNQLANYVDDEIAQIENYKIETKKLTKKI